MSESRITLARDAGLYSLPGDGLVVFAAGGGPEVLDGLPQEGTRVVSGSFPEVEALRRDGWSVDHAAPATAALAVVFLPRSKALARARVAEASRISSGGVVIDGQKTDGIEGLLRELRGRAEVSEALSKHHGKLAVLAPGAVLSDWADPGPVSIGGGFVTRAGVFSADGIDPGSRLLADALPPGLSGRVADFGAGWGYLAVRVLERDAVTEMHLIEADLAALDCARANVADPRARFHWADATAFVPEAAFDAIVMNPPFHSGRDADPGLGRAFVAAAGRCLHRRGQLWLVANRHLPYEGELSRHFGEVDQIGGDRSYKLFRAARPRKSGGTGR